MLGQLPYELRFYVFQNRVLRCNFRVGTRPSHQERGSVRFEFTEDYLRNEFGGAISFHEARRVGQKAAAAAVEALCGFEFAFAVTADYVPNFLKLCPLSHTVESGRPNQEASVCSLMKNQTLLGTVKMARDYAKWFWKRALLTSMVNDVMAGSEMLLRLPRQSAIHF
jgi:hypothetical protein